MILVPRRQRGFFAPAIFMKSTSPVVFEYTDTDQTDSDSSTYSFGSRAIGTETADRLVIVGVFATAGGLRTLSSISIGGTNGNVHALSGTNNVVIAVASRLVASGTTTNVTVTFSNNMQRCGIAVATLKRYDSATPIDTYALTEDGGDLTYDSSLDVQKDGVAFYVAGHRSSETASWSGATVEADVRIGSEAGRFSSASYLVAADQNNYSASVTWSGGSVNGGIAGVSWR